MILGRRAKESIKTAPAMTIAYGIALSMNWDRPYWAGFAVAFISFASIGQSLNMAALRMGATLAAMAASHELAAAASQCSVAASTKQYDNGLIDFNTLISTLSADTRSSIHTIYPGPAERAGQAGGGRLHHTGRIQEEKAGHH